MNLRYIVMNFTPVTSRVLIKLVKRHPDQVEYCRILGPDAAGSSPVVGEIFSRFSPTPTPQPAQILVAHETVIESENYLFC